MRKGKKVKARLEGRRHAYHQMIGQARIGDGHRDVTGYYCPGSNKK